MGILACEDALIARLQFVLGNKVRTVESLPGDWDDEMLSRLLRQVPGVFVALGGGSDPRPGGVSASIDAQWIVYVVTGHASGEAARRRGDALQAGAYELVEVIVPALHQFTVPNEGAVKFQRIENLYTGTVDRKGVAVYAVTFSQPLSMPSVVDEALLASFETFDAKWDVPPHTSAAEHRKWLGGDYGLTRPDAEDHVPLPQT